MIVRSLEEAEAFTTADGSTIRELLGIPTAPVRNQSRAEATLEPGQATERHYHREAEEIYYLVEGRATWRSTAPRPVGPGDAVLIPPARGTRSTPAAPAGFLCCAAPAYRREDTFFE